MSNISYADVNHRLQNWDVQEGSNSHQDYTRFYEPRHDVPFMGEEVLTHSAEAVPSVDQTRVPRVTNVVGNVSAVDDAALMRPVTYLPTAPLTGFKAWLGSHPKYAKPNPQMTTPDQWQRVPLSPHEVPHEVLLRLNDRHAEPSLYGLENKSGEYRQFRHQPTTAEDRAWSKVDKMFNLKGAGIKGIISKDQNGRMLINFEGSNSHKDFVWTDPTLGITDVRKVRRVAYELARDLHAAGIEPKMTATGLSLGGMRAESFAYYFQEANMKLFGQKADVNVVAHNGLGSYSAIRWLANADSVTDSIRSGKKIKHAYDPEVARSIKTTVYYLQSNRYRDPISQMGGHIGDERLPGGTGELPKNHHALQMTPGFPVDNMFGVHFGSGKATPVGELKAMSQPLEMINTSLPKYVARWIKQKGEGPLPWVTKIAPESIYSETNYKNRSYYDFRMLMQNHQSSGLLSYNADGTLRESEKYALTRRTADGSRIGLINKTAQFGMQHQPTQEFTHKADPIMEKLGAYMRDTNYMIGVSSKSHGGGMIFYNHAADEYIVQFPNDRTSLLDNAKAMRHGVNSKEKAILANLADVTIDVAKELQEKSPSTRISFVGAGNGVKKAEVAAGVFRTVNQTNPIALTSVAGAGGGVQLDKIIPGGFNPELMKGVDAKNYRLWSRPSLRNGYRGAQDYMSHVGNTIVPESGQKAVWGNQRRGWLKTHSQTRASMPADFEKAAFAAPMKEKYSTMGDLLTQRLRVSRPDLSQGPRSALNAAATPAVAESTPLPGNDEIKTFSAAAADAVRPASVNHSPTRVNSNLRLPTVGRL